MNKIVSKIDLDVNNIMVLDLNEPKGTYESTSKKRTISSNRKLKGKNEEMIKEDLNANISSPGTNKLCKMFKFKFYILIFIFIGGSYKSSTSFMNNLKIFKY